MSAQFTRASSRPTLLALAAAMAVPSLVSANTIFSDGFESYNLGALDKNAPGGANTADNGTGQPWFGPLPPNLQVINATGGVNPTGGVNMLQGRQPNDFDQDWVNIAYRFNNGNPFTGNIRLDAMFYDSLGAGGSDLRDFVALGYYNTAPADADYPGAGSLNGSSQIQRLSLGASSSQSGEFDSGFYQARIVGAADGYNSAGWFNTTAARTVGWHHLRIDVSPMLEDGTNDVSYYIDDLTTPVLTHNSELSFGGYNVIELNQFYGGTTSYIDDVSLSVITTGDVNLDGKVNADDYVLIDRGRAAGMKGYTNGDLNADGTIDDADYLLIDTAYAQSHPLDPGLLAARGAQFGSGYVASLIAAVPEPTTLMPIAIAAVSIVRRRRASAA